MSEIITPEDMIQQFKILDKFKDFKAPDLCVLTFGGEYTHAVTEVFKSPKKGPFGLKISELSGKSVALRQCRIGTVAATIDLEVLQAIGIKKFIAIGAAGGLDEHSTDDILVGDKAISDDGIGLHYPTHKSGIVENNSQLLKDWLKKFPNSKTVTAWTTSAPHRETKEKFVAFKKLGASVVEMEMASLLAVANFRKVEMLNIFTISDILTLDKWKLEMHNKNFKSQIEKLVTQVMDFI